MPAKAVVAIRPNEIRYREIQIREKQHIDRSPP
jgi:hypothetical protein